MVRVSALPEMPVGQRSVKHYPMLAQHDFTLLTTPPIYLALPSTYLFCYRTHIIDPIVCTLDLLERCLALKLHGLYRPGSYQPTSRAIIRVAGH